MRFKSLLKIATILLAFSLQAYTETIYEETIGEETKTEETIPEEIIGEEPASKETIPVETILADTISSESPYTNFSATTAVSQQVISEMESSAVRAKGVQIAGGLCTHVAVGLSAAYFYSLITEDVGPSVPTAMSILSISGAVMSHTALNISSKKATRLANNLNDEVLEELAWKSRKYYLFGLIPMGVSAIFTTLASPIAIIESDSPLGAMLYTASISALIVRDVLWHKSSNHSLQVFKSAGNKTNSGSLKKDESTRKTNLSFSPIFNAKNRGSGIVMNVLF